MPTSSLWTTPLYIGRLNTYLVNVPSRDVIPVGIVGERIEQIRRSLQPPPHRRSRLGYMSVDDFAAMIGTTRQQVMALIYGTSRPNAKNREKLALASGGVFSAKDFLEPREPTELEVVHGKIDQLIVRFRAVEKELASLASQVKTLTVAASDENSASPPDIRLLSHGKRDAQ